MTDEVKDDAAEAGEGDRKADGGAERDTLAGIEPLDALPGGRLQLHLTGFMGSGKSTVGRLLARRLVWNFLDLDAVVAREAGRPVPGIFAAEGEEGFRRRERHALRQVVQKPRAVVALGGGTLTDPANRELCAGAATVVWLDVPLAVVRERLEGGASGVGAGVEPDAAASDTGEPFAGGVEEPGRSAARGVEGRPLWGGPEELEERLEERLPGYRSAAVRIAAVAGPEAVAGAVLEALGIER